MQDLEILGDQEDAVQPGCTAGTLRGPARSIKIKDVELADVVFNSVAWPYLHLRHRHQWPAARARKLLVATIIDGMLSD